MATIINGGCNNAFRHNIIDLGPTGTGWIAGWTEPGGGGAVGFPWTGPNVFEGNVVIAGYSGSMNTNLNGVAGKGYLQGPGYPSNMGRVDANLYFNYGGGAIDVSGNIVGDSAPVTGKDPKLSGWEYTMAPDSPALALP